MTTLFEGLFCWSLSARNEIAAPLREQASFSENEAEEFLKLLQKLAIPRVSQPRIQRPAFFYLGTCHRIELYGYGADPEDVLRLWERAKEMRLEGTPRLRCGLEVVRHLIRVSSSLESEVLGETQIAGQMKEALDRARREGVLHGPLDWMAQQALRIAKKLRNQTQLGEGTVSVAHVAIDGLIDVFDDLSSKQALVVGAGTMAQQALQRLQRKGLRELTWMNRTPERIQSHPLAQGHACLPFEELHTAIWRFPITVLATSSPQSILEFERLRESERVLRSNRSRTDLIPGPRIVLDLGLPRNCDERIHGFSGFYVRNVDEFSNRAEIHSRQRQEHVARAEFLLESELATLEKLAEAKDRGPLIAELKGIFEQLASGEALEMHLEKNPNFVYVPGAIYSKLLHRLMDEIEDAGEPLASQVLESLVKAWRQPNQWLEKRPAPLKSLHPLKEKPV